MTQPPFVIVLNGISGSGKTSLANELRATLPEPWVRVGIDDILRMAPVELRPELYPSLESAMPLIRGAHRAFAALARAGNLVILDVILNLGSIAADLDQALGEVPMLVVGLHCPIELAESRG